MATTLTTKGQVTIPKLIRDRLGLGPGSAVEFEIAEDGRVILRSAGRTLPAKSRFERLRGRATAGLSTDQIMALTRGEYGATIRHSHRDCRAITRKPT